MPVLHWFCNPVHEQTVQVLRVALLALKALLADSKLDLGPDMVEAGLPRYIAQRQQQVLPAVKHVALALLGGVGHVVAEQGDDSAQGPHLCLSIAEFAAGILLSAPSARALRASCEAA